MKKKFPGHFPPTNKDMDRLWESCIFTLDTNILLNLYRYSDTTRQEFLKVLSAIKDRLWLPHRSAQEYFENRLTVIAQQEKAYDEALKTIQALQTDLSNARQHPFLTDKLMHKLTQVLGEVSEELTSTKAKHANRTSVDEIQKVIGDLFNGRVGSPYSGEQLEAICKDGEDRYARKVPPGYKDDVKDEGTPSITAAYRKYGDLILWQQVIARASEVKKGVIFINDDKKEDWYLVFRGKTLGPRPELIEEFLGKTGQGFYMYQADRFLERAAEHLKQKVTPESMDEIRDLRKRDLERHTDLLRRREEEMKLRKEELNLHARANETLANLESSRARIGYLNEKISQLQQVQSIYQEKLDRSDGGDHESLDRFLDMTSKAAAIERELVQAHEKFRALESEYEMIQQMIANLARTAEQRFQRGRG